MTVLFTRILTIQNEDYDKTKKFNLDTLLKFMFIQSVVNGGNKFQILKHLILDNNFLTWQNIDKVLDCVCSAQKTLHSLMRMCRKVNMRYARTYDHNMDMAMIPLNEYKPHLVVTLLENNTKYNFKLGDMITLIHKRLCNSCSFFPEPLEIVNPYTNIPLSYSSLYKLYFTIKASNYTMPTLFHQLFLSHFDISRFLDFNECLLKEYIIEETNKNSTSYQRNKRLSAMMYLYKNFFDYKCYTDNRKAILEKISYLHIHYLRTKYSINPNVRFKSDREIKFGLKRLQKDKKYTRQNVVYRNIAPDIHSSSPQNPFLFGQLNEVYTDETDPEDELDDDAEVEEEEAMAHDEGTVIYEETYTSESFQTDTTVEAINNWVSAYTDVSFNVTSEAISESGDNLEDYEAVISITPEQDSDPNEIDRVMNTLTEHLIGHTEPTQAHIDMMSSVVREVLGDEAADNYTQRFGQ